MTIVTVEKKLGGEKMRGQERKGGEEKLAGMTFHKRHTTVTQPQPPVTSKYGHAEVLVEHGVSKLGLSHGSNRMTFSQGASRNFQLLQYCLLISIITVVN